MKKLAEELFFYLKPTVVTPYGRKNICWFVGKKSSPASFSMPGKNLPPYRNIYSIGLDNKKGLALFSCPVSFGQNFLFCGHNFSLSAWTFLNEARSQYPTKFNKSSFN